MPSSKPTLLIIDDEADVRDVLDFVLQQQGFRVLSAANGSQGLELLRAHPDVHLVLLDVLMPGQDGPATLDALREVNPRLRCCFMTGETDQHSLTDLRKRGAAHVFRKPFSPTDLAKTVSRLIA